MSKVYTEKWLSQKAALCNNYFSDNLCRQKYPKIKRSQNMIQMNAYPAGISLFPIMSNKDCGRQDEYPSHFPWDDPDFPFGSGTDSRKKCGARYPGIPFPFPRRESSPQSSERFTEELLNIPDVTVEKTETDGEGDLVITVRNTVTGTRCNKCGRKTDKPYGHGREIILRHLSVFGRKTYIRIRPPRYQCVCCEGNPVTTQTSPWYDQRSPYTRAYENRVLFQLVNSTVSDVALREGLGYEAVEGILGRRIDTEIKWDEIGRIDIIGTDEISLKKGHRDFVTIVTALTDGELMILAVLPDREKVADFFI